MAPNLIRPSQMLIFDPATVSVCYMGQRQVAPQGAGRPACAAAAAATATAAAASSTSPPPPTAKRTYVKNISPEEKILRKWVHCRIYEPRAEDLVFFMNIFFFVPYRGRVNRTSFRPNVFNGIFFCLIDVYLSTLCVHYVLRVPSVEELSLHKTCKGCAR